MIEVPPDATPFVSHGKSYYLYLGLKELRALQRKWGLQREPGDTESQYEAKTLAFEIRLQSQEWEDRRDIMNASLTNWAVAAGVEGVDGVPLSDDEALRVFEGAQMPGEKKRKRAPADRYKALWARFNEDASGQGPSEETGESDGDPKAPDLKASTPSGS